MLNTPLPTQDDLSLSLRLELQLHRAGPQSQWSAELSVPDCAQRLRFASLPALIGFIARLDRPLPMGGIR